MEPIRTLSNTSSSTSSGTSRTSNTSLSSATEHPLATLARLIGPKPPPENTSLPTVIEEHRQSLLHGHTQSDYLSFHPVCLEEYQNLSDDDSSTSKICRFTYDLDTKVLICKVMPSQAHERAIKFFDLLITLELHTMNLHKSVLNDGAARVEVGSWRKEADSCWRPRGATGKLGLVLEMGMSETRAHLAIVARAWVETESANLVVTVDINRTKPEIVLKLWQLIPSPTSSPIRQPRSLTASYTQSISIIRTEAGTIVSGEVLKNGEWTAITSLEISFIDMMGRLPTNPLERNIVLSQESLVELAEVIWGSKDWQRG
ncbi:hypothetical protein BJX65DRAFT_227833 [Aspergillus insuetus]